MSAPITLCEAARRIRGGELRPLDLLEACLERLHRWEDRLHAWVIVDEAGARRAARRAGEQIAAGDYRGPLHGIPLGIKDIVDVEGFPTRAGSAVTESEPKRADAPLVAALRRAGAIVLGKTVTCEFACFDPSPTRNPWSPQLDHTPGGSSSGSAAAVAVAACLGAVGTQTGGSLVRPATYCGVAACKPTFDRVRRKGVAPVSHHLDQPGVIARTAADLDCLMRCLPGVEAPEARSRPDAPRLGLVSDFFLDEADATIRRATGSVLDTLAAAGARIERAELPRGFADVHRMHRTIMAVEGAAVHRRRFAEHRDAYGPVIAGLLDEGLATPAVDYAEALAHQRDFRRRIAAVFEAAAPVDALVMPATDTTAPRSLSTTGDSKFQAPWSHAGVPVVSIPCGVASDGMPAGIQLVGPAGHDTALLGVARWCEQQLGVMEVPEPPG